MASETVMSKEMLLEKLRECKRLYPLRIGYEVEMYIAQAQDAISFAAGEKQGIEKGRKEVVEWVEQNTETGEHIICRHYIDWEGLQAQLKIWGIQ